jgi:hypothetical protein
VIVTTLCRIVRALTERGDEAACVEAQRQGSPGRPRLGINRSTLKFRMKKLGIERPTLA